MKMLFNLFVLSILIIAHTANSQSFSSTNEYIDDNTKWPTAVTPGQTIMHICPTGFMSGFHEQRNDLLCLHKYGNLTAAQPYDDFGTNRLGMHACPSGLAMIGIHVGNNILKCGRPGFPGATDSWIYYHSKIDTNSEYVSYGGAASLRYGMHACPEGWVMTGIHVVGNRFLCSMVVPNN